MKTFSMKKLFMNKKNSMINIIKRKTRGKRTCNLFILFLKQIGLNNEIELRRKKKRINKETRRRGLRGVESNFFA